MTSYKSSRYVITVPLRDGRVLAYSGMTGALAVWTPDEAETYRAVVNGEIRGRTRATADLVYGGYLVPKGTRELEQLHIQYRAHRFNRRTLILTVAPTLACNFACDYCFQCQDKPMQTMGQDVQDAIVAFVEKLAP